MRLSSEGFSAADAADAASFLKMAKPAFQGEGNVLCYDSVAGKRYQIQYKRDLASSEPWQDLGGPVTAGGSVCGVTDLVNQGFGSGEECLPIPKEHAEWLVVPPPLPPPRSGRRRSPVRPHRRQPFPPLRSRVRACLRRPRTP